MRHASRRWSQRPGSSRRELIGALGGRPGTPFGAGIRTATERRLTAWQGGTRATIGSVLVQPGRLNSDIHRTWGAARGDSPTMSTTPRSTVVGVFRDREDAREAIEALKEDGFNPDTISILSPEKQDTEEMADDTGTHAGSGAASGAMAGGILGGVGGWLLGIGALAIPGIGPFIAAG